MGETLEAGRRRSPGGGNEGLTWDRGCEWIKERSEEQLEGGVNTTEMEGRAEERGKPGAGGGGGSGQESQGAGGTCTAKTGMGIS